jgi:hypothetical protein
VHNPSGRAAQAHLEPGGDGALVDLFRDDELRLEGGGATLALEPYDARWFRLRRPGQRLPP